MHCTSSSLYSRLSPRLPLNLCCLLTCRLRPAGLTLRGSASAWAARRLPYDWSSEIIIIHPGHSVTLNHPTGLWAKILRDSERLPSIPFWKLYQSDPTHDSPVAEKLQTLVDHSLCLLFGCPRRAHCELTSLPHFPAPPLPNFLHCICPVLPLLQSHFLSILFISPPLHLHLFSSPSPLTSIDLPRPVLTLSLGYHVVQLPRA